MGKCALVKEWVRRKMAKQKKSQMTIKRYQDLYNQIKINEGDFVLTINMKTKDLSCFVKPPYTFYSKDSLNNSEKIVLQKIYHHFKIEQPEKFCSLACRTKKAPGSSALFAYGDVVLVIKVEEVSHNVVLFNGDVKDLIRKIDSDEDIEKYVEVMKDISSKSIVGTLEELKSRQRPNSSVTQKRLIGQYFEARLLRPLKITDLNGEIYIPSNSKSCSEVVKMVNQLENLINANTRD